MILITALLDISQLIFFFFLNHKITSSNNIASIFFIGFACNFRNFELLQYNRLRQLH